MILVIIRTLFLSEVIGKQTISCTFLLFSSTDLCITPILHYSHTALLTQLFPLTYWSSYEIVIIDHFLFISWVGRYDSFPELLC